jgi:long-chain acyl-CoA synthetase
MSEIDAMSAAEILQGLPNRISDVIHIDERPDDPAFVEGERTWSYSEFGRAVDTVTVDFKRLKIRVGDRVLLVGENSVALSAFIFACSKLDAWPGVANPRLSARELDQIYLQCVRPRSRRC